MKRFLIIQTAFLGDVVLTLPLVQALKKSIPDSEIDFVAIPQTADIVKNHPDIANVIVYDKHGKQKSFLSFLKFRGRLRSMNYDAVLCPHRSLRSCLLTSGTQAKIRIGFNNSALKGSFTNILPWKFGMHEVERNLSLLQPVVVNGNGPQLSVMSCRRFAFLKNIGRRRKHFFRSIVSSGHTRSLLPGQSGKQSAIR